MQTDETLERYIQRTESLNRTVGVLAFELEQKKRYVENLEARLRREEILKAILLAGIDEIIREDPDGWFGNKAEMILRRVHVFSRENIIAEGIGEERTNEDIEIQRGKCQALEVCRDNAGS